MLSHDLTEPQRAALDRMPIHLLHDDGRNGRLPPGSPSTPDLMELHRLGLIELQGRVLKGVKRAEFWCSTSLGQQVLEA